MTDLIERFENLLSQGQDNALLRFGLGNAYLKAGDASRAAEHLREAVRHDPGYSAAWKSLGKALAESGRTDESVTAYEEGIRVAQGKGDLQAAKEMQVFLKRLRKIKSDQ